MLSNEKRMPAFPCQFWNSKLIIGNNRNTQHTFHLAHSKWLYWNCKYDGKITNFKVQPSSHLICCRRKTQMCKYSGTRRVSCGSMSFNGRVIFRFRAVPFSSTSFHADIFSTPYRNWIISAVTFHWHSLLRYFCHSLFGHHTNERQFVRLITHSIQFGRILMKI